MRDTKFNIPISLGILLFAIGSISYVFHFPNSLQFRMSGLVVIFVFYLLRFFFKKQKLTPDIIKVILVSAWSLTTFMRIQHFPVHPIIHWIYFSALIYWGSLEIKGYFYKSKSNPSKQEQISHKVFLVAGGITTISFLAKIMHWPRADVLLILGVLSAGTWGILEVFRKK